jgi:hypothetical protein
MIDSFINNIANEIFTPEGATHLSMNMPHAQMVSNAYGYKTRTFVGLTEDEIKECFQITPDQYLPAQIYKRIEAKLKEKNT